MRNNSSYFEVFDTIINKYNTKHLVSVILLSTMVLQQGVTRCRSQESQPNRNQNPSTSISERVSQFSNVFNVDSID